MPILISIVVFPLIAVATICLLRHYNRRARAKDKFRYLFGAFHSRCEKPLAMHQIHPRHGASTTHQYCALEEMAVVRLCRPERSQCLLGVNHVDHR